MRYSKQINTQLRMMKAEKYYVDKKNQEFYLVRTKRFLGSLSPEDRQRLLSRKSFSISLSKLVKAIEDEKEYQERYSAPASLVSRNRRPSVLGNFDTNDTKGRCKSFVESMSKKNAKLI